MRYAKSQHIDFNKAEPEEGRTALILACQGKINKFIIEAFCNNAKKFNIDLFKEDNDGKCAMEYAEEQFGSEFGSDSDFE